MRDETLLTRVQLAGSATVRWMDRTQDFVIGLAGDDEALLNVPQDQAREESDGSLTLFLRLPDGRGVEERVEPSEWSWMPGTLMTH